MLLRWSGRIPAEFSDDLAMANDSRYGLSAGIFTQDIEAALPFIEQVDSGMGKEGPAYAISEMTEVKTVVIHGRSYCNASRSGPEFSQWLK